MGTHRVLWIALLCEGTCSWLLSWCCRCISLIFIAKRWGGAHFCCCGADEDLKKPRGEEICSRSHSNAVGEMGFDHEWAQDWQRDVWSQQNTGQRSVEEVAVWGEHEPMGMKWCLEPALSPPVVFAACCIHVCPASGSFCVLLSQRIPPQIPTLNKRLLFQFSLWHVLVYLWDLFNSSFLVIVGNFEEWASSVGLGKDTGVGG